MCSLLWVPGVFAIWALYLLTSVLTEMVSNNAVAVVITLTALGLQMRWDMMRVPLLWRSWLRHPRHLRRRLGTTNTLVSGPGGYRFTDFMKIDPLNLSIGILVSVIPWVFPFDRTCPFGQTRQDVKTNLTRREQWRAIQMGKHSAPQRAPRRCALWAVFKAIQRDHCRCKNGRSDPEKNPRRALP